MTGVQTCALPIFTPDGRHLLWAVADEKGIYHLWVAPLESALKGHRIEMDLPNSYYPAFSRDGKWLAFCSRDETGGVDIWIAAWPPDEVGAP